MAKVKIKETVEGADHVRGDIVTNGHFTILITSTNHTCMSGVVLKTDDNKVPEFSHCTGLIKSNFRKFHGTISLIQE